jgi:hypothetical protein
MNNKLSTVTIDVTIGVRDHSGWAIVVALASPIEQPSVVCRERATVCPPELPRQAFHAAADDRAHAGRLIGRVERAVMRLTAGVVADIVTTIEQAVPGARIGGMAVPIGPPRLPTDLDDILAVHPLLHAAEGDLYRRAFCAAAATRAIPVVRFDPKAATSQVAAVLDCPAGVLDARLRHLGAGLGPPWQQDHRIAAAGAMLAAAHG